MSGYHPVEYSGRAIKFYLGDNTGLVHEFVDSTVTNGITYYYSVVAYDSGTDEIPPTENQSVILRDPITGVLTFDDNTVEVTPGPVSAGTVDAEAGIGGTPVQVAGNSTGDIKIKILDGLKVKNKIYSIEFNDENSYNVKDSTGVTETFTSKDTVFVDLGNKNIDTKSVVVKDAGGNVVDASKYFVNKLFGKIRGLHSGDLPKGEEFSISYKYYPVYESTLMNNEDANPAFDGMKVFVMNDPLDLDYENSGWVNETATNIKDSINHMPPVIGVPSSRVHYRADWEVRWNSLAEHAEVSGTDTTWVYDEPGDTVRSNLSPVTPSTICPFTIWNVTDNQPAQYLVIENTGSGAEKPGRWNFGEWIVIQPQGETGFNTAYDILFALPSDSGVTPVYPEKGDVYKLATTKPFTGGDKYVFESKAAKVSGGMTQNQLDNVYVVPNPYVAYSDAEGPGRTSEKRGDRVLQFRNLPQKCTIRIYTITGDLVDTIEKDDFSSMATWDLLSFEGQRIAYGVYIYHIEVPGVGEKIGRFAVIK